MSFCWKNEVEMMFFRSCPPYPSSRIRSVIPDKILSEEVKSKILIINYKLFKLLG